ALVGAWQPLEEMAETRTFIQAPVPVAEPRLRDVSLAVDNATHPTKPMPAADAADTIIDLPLAPITEPSGVAMTTVSGELMPSHLATAVSVEAPGFAMGEPPTDPIAELAQRRVANPGDVAPIGRPGRVPGMMPKVILPKPPTVMPKVMPKVIPPEPRTV